MNAAGRHGTGTVTQVIDPFEFVASGLSGIASGTLTRGRLSWTSGASNGLAGEIKAHSFAASHRIGIALPMGGGVSVGDTFEAFVGCDRAFATCRDRFANALNFGGFPHMPGNDFAMSYPNRGGGNDGSKLT